MVGRASLFWLDHLAITGLVPLPNLSSLGLRGPIFDRLFSSTRWKGLVMRISGTVKFFNGAKGFGFISPADGSKDVFVHATALERAGIRSLNEGDKVTFVLEDDRKGRGKQAAQIELA
jgi:cold shock protein